MGRVNAAWLKVFADFLEKADARFRALAAEVRAAAVPGPAGEKGAAGERGGDGPPGPQGPIGEKGDSGLPGDRGVDGAPGTKGDPGEQGPVGITGEKGAPGADGIPGRDGRDGTKGDPGRDGKDGAPGRDGITPEQLEAAVQKATADVLAAIEFDGRTWKIGDRTIRTPAPQYRGVYAEDEDYGRGDFATWAGSLWHANGPTKSKPGDGDSWVLVAKKGRDGRDGKDGAPAAPRPVVAAR